MKMYDKYHFPEQINIRLGRELTYSVKDEINNHAEKTAEGRLNEIMMRYFYR